MIIFYPQPFGLGVHAHRAPAQRIDLFGVYKRGASGDGFLIVIIDSVPCNGG